MTSGERQRERAKTRRRSAALESDDEGGCGQWVGPESCRVKFLDACTKLQTEFHNFLKCYSLICLALAEEEYCPENGGEEEEESACSEGESEGESILTPAKKKVNNTLF